MGKDRTRTSLIVTNTALPGDVSWSGGKSDTTNLSLVVMVVILDDDEILFRDHEVFAVHLVKNLRFENFRGGAAAKSLVLEKHQSIHP